VSSTTQTNIPSATNPLQTNNTALMVVGYLAGIAAAKLPWFDLATWNYIILSVGGVLFTGGSLLLNRKSAVVATVANMPEVKSVELDKTSPGVNVLVSSTPRNVVAS
jgi:hypothetical protein